MKTLVQFSYIITLNILLAPKIAEYIGFEFGTVSSVIAHIAIMLFLAYYNGIILNWAFSSVKYKTIMIDSKVISETDLTKMLEEEMKRRVDKLQEEE